MIATSKQVEEFYILNDPCFKKCCIACLTAVKRSIRAEIGRKRKATAPLTYEMGQQLLASLTLDRREQRGCLLRIAYYTIHNFCVRGQKELYSITDIDFSICYDATNSKHVRFDERESKDHKVDLRHCQPEKMRRFVTCCHANIVETFKTYIAHLPKWNESDPPGRHPFYFTPHRRISERVGGLVC